MLQSIVVFVLNEQFNYHKYAGSECIYIEHMVKMVVLVGVPAAFQVVKLALWNEGYVQ